MRRAFPIRLLSAALPVLALFSAPAQQEKHGRGYKAPPQTAPVTVVVAKASNGKPMASTSVIFRSVRNDASNGNLEMKTDGEGHATLDLLEVGSHVTVQVIAPGYATFATDFDLTDGGKQLLVKLERPRAQVSAYDDGQDRPSPVQPGVQEHRVTRPTLPTAAPPAPVSPTGPLQTVPPVNSPATGPGTTPGSGTPATPGSPQ